MDFHADPDAKLYAHQAAAYFGCSRQRIARWVSLGKLAAVDHDWRGVPRYRYADLLEAERATRRHPNSRRLCHAL